MGDAPSFGKVAEIYVEAVGEAEDRFAVIVQKQGGQHPGVTVGQPAYRPKEEGNGQETGEGGEGAYDPLGIPQQALPQTQQGVVERGVLVDGGGAANRGGFWFCLEAGEYLWPTGHNPGRSLHSPYLIVWRVIQSLANLCPRA